MGFRFLASIFSLLVALQVYNLKVGTLAQLHPIINPNATVLETYIITVKKPRDAHVLSDEGIEEWHRSFLPNTTLSSGEPRLLYSYRYAMNGFAARLTRDELKVIESMDGFLNAQPDRTRKLGTTYTPRFLGLEENNDEAWRKGNYGQGVIIGVLDSGIIHNHPSFTDNGGMPMPPPKWRGCCHFGSSCERSACNNKLIGARGLTSSSEATDFLGHGSHCAGIAAGNRVPGVSVLGQAGGTASGMAPKAHLATYKVCSGTSYDEHECEDSSIANGINDAIHDGVDVLSLSLESSGGNFYEDSVTRATFRAMYKHDILSCACAGNTGAEGASSVVNDAPWILTVGASSTDRVVRSTLKLGNGAVYEGEGAYLPTNLPSDPIVPLEYPGKYDFNATMRKCLPGAFEYLDIQGKIVLCGFNGTQNANKSDVVYQANGAGIVILNQEVDMHTTLSEATSIPASHLNHLDSIDAVNYCLTDPNPTGTITLEGTQINARQAPAVAAFSGRGPSKLSGGIMKPDIIGPGVNIVSAWTREVGPPPHPFSNKAFNFARGCSMATPHLAGIAALVKSAHPKWTASEIKSAIMTTAYTVDKWNNPISDERSPGHAPADIYAMGAGHVDPPRAIDPGLLFSIPKKQYIGYLCFMGYRPKDIADMADEAVDCRYQVRPDQLNYPALVANLRAAPPLANGSVSCTQKTLKRTVKNVGPAKSTYTAQIKKPKGVSVKVCPKKLEFKHLNQEKSFTVKLVKTKCKAPARGTHATGSIKWASATHNVTCPLSVNF